MPPNPHPPLPHLLPTTPRPELHIYTCPPLRPLLPALLSQASQLPTSAHAVLVGFADAPGAAARPGRNVHCVSYLAWEGGEGEGGARGFWDAVRGVVGKAVAASAAAAGGAGVVVVLDTPDVLPVLHPSVAPSDVVAEILATFALVSRGSCVVLLGDNEGGQGIAEGLGGEADVWVGWGERGRVRIVGGEMEGQWLLGDEGSWRRD